MAKPVSVPKVHALITGPPGIGKTTLVRAVCQQLQKGVEVSGFYTEEVRGGGTDRTRQGPRLGFDVVTLDGQRGPLARVESEMPVCEGVSQARRPVVGRYIVHLEYFEEIALPTLQQPSNSGAGPAVYVIDEIGKMELFSRKFADRVQRLFNLRPGEKHIIMATIPVAQQKSHWLVEELRKRNDCVLFEVNERNQEDLIQEVLEFIETRLH